ncbi:MAG: hypothetical protein HW412_197 [Bacteroidetes bacterium]|nr:hypothetical protein [Bacteroidota bacterium]
MTRGLQFTYLSSIILLLSVDSSGFQDGANPREESFRILSEWAHPDGREDHVPEKCGLPVLSAAINNRASLSPVLRTSLQTLLVRPSLDTSIRIGNYRIHFDTSASSANTPAMLDGSYNRIPGSYREFVDSTAAILTFVASYDTSVLGYLPPPTDNGFGGGPEYDIYLVELGGSYYGVTTPETPINNKPDGGTFTTYMEIDNDFNFVFPDSNKGLPALRVTLAHELHHAIQLGNYGYWTGDVYFYEITSVWMEDVVYTDVNDYYQYLGTSQGQFRRPDIPFTSNNFIVYSRGIWGQFIAKRFGRDVMRRAWEEIRDARPLLAMDNALQEVTSSFRQSFSEWSLWNFFTGTRDDTTGRYYPEGSFYPLMSQTPVSFSPPSRAVAGSLNALAAKYYQVLGGPDTLTLILSNTNFAAGLANSNVQFPYTYLLNINRVDDSYKSTPAGIFFKLDAPDLTNWFTWDVVRNGVGGSGANAIGGACFPNPFLVDGKTRLRIPITSTVLTTGTLYVFTSSMDLVYSSELTSRQQFAGQQAFEWNGTTNNGEIVQTGVYFYTVDVQGQTAMGKIVVVRK